MKIRLNEIPENGQDYIYNRNTAELNEALIDLIQNNPYEVHLYIKPLNSKDYTINGEVLTTTPMQCSRCAIDFDLEIKKKLNEILIPTQEHDRNSKYAKSSVNINEDDETVSVTEYSKLQFDLGEFLHEAVALEIPFTPYCTACSKPNDDKTFIYDENMTEEAKPNPFKALKGIKLN